PRASAFDPSDFNPRGRGWVPNRETSRAEFLIVRRHEIAHVLGTRGPGRPRRLATRTNEEDPRPRDGSRRRVRLVLCLARAGAGRSLSAVLELRRGAFPAG